MSNAVRAVRPTSYENFEHGAGVAIVNIDISDARTAEDIRLILKAVDEKDRLGVTRGGIEITVDTKWLEIQFDDMPGPFVGSSEKGTSTVQVKFTILEATPENTKLAMGTADVLDFEGVTVVQERDYVDILKDYIDHLYIIGRQGKDKITVLEFDNVFSMGGYNEKKNDEGQTEISLTLQATKSDMENEGDLPYRKMFFPIISPVNP